MRMWEVLAGQWTTVGGPVFAALIVVSVLATATAIQKALILRRMGVGRHRQLRAALDAWFAGAVNEAWRHAEADNSAACRVAREAMIAERRWPFDKERAREVATAAALSLIEQMGRHMRLLDTAVQAAPMLGLLGTVLGMIAAFNELSEAGGTVDASALAGGIWVALGTTAFGLAIAIPFYFVASWFEGRIEREKAVMEQAILAIVYGGGTPAPGRSQLGQSEPTAHDESEQRAVAVRTRRAQHSVSDQS
jgi:biopolymer transport protein ExbB